MCCDVMAYDAVTLCRNDVFCVILISRWLYLYLLDIACRVSVLSFFEASQLSPRETTGSCRVISAC